MVYDFLGYDLATSRNFTGSVCFNLLDSALAEPIKNEPIASFWLDYSPVTMDKQFSKLGYWFVWHKYNRHAMFKDDILA